MYTVSFRSHRFHPRDRRRVYHQGDRPAAATLIDWGVHFLRYRDVLLSVYPQPFTVTGEAF